MKNPQTTKEWQEAVDMAELCLYVDSAVQYGLLKVVPLDQTKDWWYRDSNVNVERCRQILEQGKAKNITPKPLDDLIKTYMHP
jgi:hypothetical protein